MKENDEIEQQVPDSGEALVCVVEDDSSIQNLVKQCIDEMPGLVPSIFTGGKEAWAALSAQQFDLVILDWKIPSVSGAALLNRLRTRKEYQFVPVLVMSGFLRSKDFSLLEELPFTAMLEKPFQFAFFKRKIRELLKIADWHRTQGPVVEKLIGALKTPDPKSAVKFIESLVKQSLSHVPLTIAASRTLIAERHLVEAEHLLKTILKMSPDCLIAMSELGKVYLLTGRDKEAMKILSHAREKSPDNIERLCLIGTLHLQNLESAEAKACFAQALAIDAEDANAEAGSVLADNMDSFLTRQSVTSIPETFAGLLNAIGISFVRVGSFAEGIEHYQAAMHYVSDNPNRARLAFNLALAYWRWQQPEDAFKWFSQSVKLSEGKLEKALRNAAIAQAHLERSGVKTSTLALPDLDDLTEPDGQAPTPATEDILPSAPDPEAKVGGSLYQVIDVDERARPERNRGAPAPVVAEAQRPQDSSPDDANQGYFESAQWKDFTLLAVKYGEHKGTLELKVRKLLEVHGLDALRAAVKEAAAQGVPTAGRVSFYIQNAKKAG